MFKQIKEWGKGNCGAEETGGDRRTKVGRGAGIDETGRRCEEKKSGGWKDGSVGNSSRVKHADQAVNAVVYLFAQLPPTAAGIASRGQPADMDIL